MLHIWFSKTGFSCLCKDVDLSKDYFIPTRLPIFTSLHLLRIKLHPQTLRIMAPIITISNGDHVNGHHIDQVPLRSQSDQLCNIITPVGMLSYGFEENVIREELQHLKTTNVPTALILDSGSTDSGPTKLALGTMTSPRSSYERDLRKLLSLTHDYHIPLIISSAGGDGQNDHVDEFLNIIQEICDEPGNGYVSSKEM